MLEFDVALCGRYFGFDGPAEIERDYVGPFVETQTASVAVDESETLGTLIDRAADIFRIKPNELYAGRRPSEIVCGIAFFMPGHLDPETIDYPLRQRKIVGVDGAGRVYWRWFKDVPCSDLLRAAERGLVVGDPRRPYFVPQVPAGGVGASEWHAVLNALSALYALGNSFGPIANYYVVVEIVTRIAKRIKPGERALKKHHADWESRGGRPYDLVQVLSAKPWDADELAGLLGCSGAEAQAVLWAFGFAFDQASRRWVRADDCEADAIRYALALAFADDYLPKHLAKRDLRDALIIYSRTGAMPQRPPGGAAQQESRIDMLWHIFAVLHGDLKILFRKARLRPRRGRRRG